MRKLIFVLLIILFVIAVYTDNENLSIISLLAIIVYVFYHIARFITLRFDKGKRAEILLISIEYLGTDADMPDDFDTYIAGANYRCSFMDIGGFIGFAIPQFDNKHDINAVAIYNKKGKHLGFIPRIEAKQFREWCDTRPVPCVGYIKMEDGKYRGA